MRTTSLAAALALAAFSFAPATAQAQHILLLNDQCGGSTAHFPTALGNLGLAFTETNSSSAFLVALQSGTAWDLVIIDQYAQFLGSEVIAEVGRYVEAGGRAYINYWDWDFDLARIFDAEPLTSLFSPAPIRRWDAAHPLFATPNAVPDLTPTRDTCHRDGARFRVIDRGYAAAGYTASPASGEAGVIVGNDGRTVLFAGIAGLFDDDADFDGIADMAELAENAIRFLLEIPRYALVGLGGKCLDVEAADPSDGTPVNLYRCHGGDNQRWRLELSSTPQRIVGLGEKCLIPGPARDSGDTRVVIGECGGADDLWRLQTAGPASPTTLVHVDTGRCLDVEGAVADDGTPTVLFDCHGNDNQLWRPSPEDCVRDWRGLCLSRDRFRIDLTWHAFDDTAGSGRIVPIGSDDSGLLWFFEADNWEMLIKVLDGCHINQRFWVFAAATTTVEYTLRVTDTATGEIREYFNPLGEAADAITDTDAFASCSATAGVPGPPPAAEAAPVASAVTEGLAPALKGACVPSETNLCLADGRFAVEAAWRDFSGTVGPGKVVPFGSPDSGLLWFFSSGNWELLIKVLDGCHINQRFWLLAAATTNVEYTLRVTDTATGVFREHFNPLGTAAPALVDTFATCP